MHQIMARRKYDATLLDAAHACRGPTVAAGAAFANLHKHDGSVGRTHDEVNFTTAAPRRPLIAHEQAQALSLQIAQGLVLCGVSHLFGRGLGASRLPWF